MVAIAVLSTGEDMVVWRMVERQVKGIGKCGEEGEDALRPSLRKGGKKGKPLTLKHSLNQCTVHS